MDVTTAIQRATTTDHLLNGEWPERFFEVTMQSVNRHAASTLLNVDTVRNYLGEVCPVPMASVFH